ncbi:hypothetical protein M501DRAFT_928191 [Patellaria atrata CBS 101060]|uniref:Up-regulated during septation protein 1 domain-containing protein n=1 Tax=Patellaria atrata CBS 101060 TaxID=1346257 RepID=A0A9P4SFB1_9PEZI|nr:hypothetical protein M501DRAFT_928191 [Patellaria atrata CBS 101060]
MHLLVETAIGDSQNYEILSFEELDVLKKEESSLRSRIEGTTRKFMMEMKVRDAAASLNRLYLKKNAGGLSGTFGGDSGSRSSNGSVKGESLAQSEEELVASKKKCEDLSTELAQLRSRHSFVQTRLLKHTAGILQMTHKGPSKSKQQSSLPGDMTNGVRPDSPASIHTYENGRREVLSTDDSFDDRSLYRPHDNLEGLMDPFKGSNSDGYPSENVSAEKRDLALQAIEERLEELNHKLKDLIVLANPQRKHSYTEAPKAENQGSDREARVDAQLGYLAQGLNDAITEQGVLHQKGKHAQNEIEGRLEGLNTYLYNLLRSSQIGSEEEHPAPPAISGQGPQEQIHYMQDTFYGIEQLNQSMNRARDSLDAKVSESRSLSSEHQDKYSHYEAVLTGLWSIMLAGEEEAREKKMQRRQQMGTDPSIEEELSPDEDFDHNQQFSIQAFSERFQRLFTTHSHFKEKHSILRRQVKQQRDLNVQHEEDNEAQRQQYEAQLQALNAEIVQSNTQLERLTLLLEDADRQRNHWADQNELSEQGRKAAEETIAELEAHLADMQDDIKITTAETQAQLNEADEKMKTLTSTLEAVRIEKATAERTLNDLSQRLAQKDEEYANIETERTRLEADVVRLTTDLTIARAELDGAYGSRAQRAADVAGNPSVKKELDDLTARNDILASETEALRARVTASEEKEAALKRELTETLAEFEELTRASVESEQEREALERVVDGLREKVEGLEVQLGDEKVRWLGMKSPGASPGQPGGGETTSMMVLRNEFKKMMRETRAEGSKALRAEQEERRKLEALIRQMRREQTPTKSRLGQSMTAS